jgi:lipoyl(octanoyl) transferase
LGREEYGKKGIDLVETDRGGDVTFHGPGQLVMYPIFDVSRHGRDLHKWMRDLEETMLLVCREFGLEGRRFAPHTGAWVGDLKIAAIGVKVRRWISLHGIALNCSNDLGAFELIVPCGIQGYGVTSLSDAVGREVSVEEAKGHAIDGFETVFC